ncbi:N-(5'-phosphoribosyl)anthranilate isomerase [Solitalea longa]|uniref:N-(5'-phosphoribosyl)anthranilate isomerase n=1 Tax=Solitalea longa TaxID=2079460 RepID=A0A2S5A4P1_9SPHI|nr:phosphoribosylanthranilate isomerase [Solitalea longa]POY37561.1 N-(5'-phosphoribosyl)anthranilate isomerase [Solitalea longa]
MKIKICGMKFRENIEDVVQLKPDYLGFIFYPQSPRYVDDLSVLKAIPSSIKKVAVFVNAKLQDALEIVADYDFNAVQLHGNEKPDYCSQFKSATVEVIKAFGVNNEFDFSDLKRYKDSCDTFLFDTKSDSHGGTGKTFNWDILKNYKEPKPFFLSGGIGLDNLHEVNTIQNYGLPIYGLDLNSKLEVSPGLKDTQKVKEAIDKIKGI